MEQSEWEDLVARMRRLVENQEILHVQMQEDGSLKVTRNLPPVLIVPWSPGPDCQALLEVIGCQTMRPGQFWYTELGPIETTEETITPEILEDLVFNDEESYFYKVEMLADGSMIVYRIDEPPHIGETLKFGAGAPHIAMMEKHIGELKPGMVVMLKDKNADT
jgi:hypothetical protein